MEFLVIGLIVVGLFVFIWLKRKRTASKNQHIVIGADFGIQMTKDEIDLERQSNEEVMKILQDKIAKSGFFIPEKIPGLMAILKDGKIPFGRVNTKLEFDDDAYLTVEEKKALGLNTKMKYSKKFIEYFDPVSFKIIEPKSTLACMHHDAFFRVARKKELLKLKKLGWVKQVKIFCPDAEDCGKIRALKKTYNIDEVPELPLEGCNSEFCACSYEAVLPKH